MTKFINDFKKFINRGNIWDLIIAVSVGTAFSRIASSLVNDLVMPVISLAIGKEQFSNLKIILREATETTKAITFNYGNFLQNVLDFVVIAIAIFVIFRFIQKSKTRLEEFQKKGGLKSLIFKGENSEPVKVSLNEETVNIISEKVVNNAKDLSIQSSNTEKLLEEIRDLLKK